jgi:diguanylate cyclase (GGDEF)-like protein/PAS domain S-box-containing protein
MENALRESEARFREAFDYAAIGRAIAIPQGKFIRVNNSFCQMLGFSREELLSKTWSEITHPDDLNSSLECAQNLITGKIPSFRLVHQLIHKCGKPIWVDLTVVILKDSNSVPLYVVGDIVDITEQKNSEQVLKYLATHDPLTGLPNRTLFSDRLNHALLLAKRSNTYVAVMFIDLDGFKSVNDAFGHEMGDQVLKRVAKRLNSCVRKSDTIARLSGDEFTLAIENLHNPADATVIAKKILNKLSVPLQEEGQQITITASIGISIYPTDGKDERSLLKTADAAMYQVKNSSKNGYRFFG